MRIGRLVYVQKQIEGNVRGQTCLDQELIDLPMCGKAVQQYPLFNELRQIACKLMSSMCQRLL